MHPTSDTSPASSSSTLLLKQLKSISYLPSKQPLMDNCSSLDPRAFRSSFPDTSWFSDAFARDNEALTRALQISLSDASSPSRSASGGGGGGASSSLLRRLASPIPSFQVSAGTKRPRTGVSPLKAGKRKSRASTRSPTTYIAVDPADFRRMVQQVTGVRTGGGDAGSDFAVLKPEPQWLGRAPPPLQSCLPTLDTSAFLLDRVEEGRFGSGGPAAEEEVGGFELEPFPSFPFPTLESWSVM